jgi:hypothetical protein
MISQVLGKKENKMPSLNPQCVFLAGVNTAACVEYPLFRLSGNRPKVCMEDRAKRNRNIYRKRNVRGRWVEEIVSSLEICLRDSVLNGGLWEYHHLSSLDDPCPFFSFFLKELTTETLDTVSKRFLILPF